MPTKIKDLLTNASELIAMKASSAFSAISFDRFLPMERLSAISKAMPSSSSELFERVMAPCNSLMGRLDLSTKLLSLFAGIFIAVLILSSHTLSKLSDERDIASAEQRGVHISRQIMDVIVQTQKHRGQVNLMLSGQNMDAAIDKTRVKLNADLKKLDVSIEANPDFELASAWTPIVEELRSLSNGKIASTTTENVSQHSRLIAQIMRLSNLNNEKSGLLFDPIAASYLLMDVSIQKIPVWIEHMSVLRGVGAAYIKTGSIDAAGKTVLLSRLDAIAEAVNAATAMNDALKRAGESIVDEQAIAIKANEDFVADVRINLLGENVSGDPMRFFDKGTQAIEKAIALQMRLNDRLSSILDARVSSLGLQNKLFIVILLLAFLITSYLALGFYLGLMRRMLEVGQLAFTVSSGDLTKRTNLEGNDELARTGNALETMNMKLSAVVANVRNDANMVAFLGRKLASGISDMSIRTEQQAASLEETTASVQDLAETVKQNALNAKAADSLASNVRLIAEASGDSMRAAVETMGGIHASAKKMEEIVNLIDRIAFQTDILALNAAVEASHAGEQGKGFAVVASEVRGLAQRSAEAARQIRRLIDDSVSRVETGVEQIDEVSMTLSDIVAGIRNLAVNTSSISNASSDQSNGLTQISEAIKQLDDITQSNGKMAEEAKLASMDMEERALTLTQTVSGFKLRQGTADEAYAMTKKAIALYHVNGIATLKRITEDNDGIFSDRDMYVFAFDRKGQYVAFAGNAAKLKVNILHIDGLDGRKLVDDAFALTESGGWIDYKITNPVSQRIEEKTSYIELVSEDMVFGCGVYKNY